MVVTLKNQSGWEQTQLNKNLQVVSSKVFIDYYFIIQLAIDNIFKLKPYYFITRSECMTFFQFAVVLAWINLNVLRLNRRIEKTDTLFKWSLHQWFYVSVNDPANRPAQNSAIFIFRWTGDCREQCYQNIFLYYIISLHIKNCLITPLTVGIGTATYNSCKSKPHGLFIGSWSLYKCS